MEDFMTVSGGEMVIRIPAELDHHSAEAIRGEADRALRSRSVKKIIFDFRDTVFMDSSGIGMIMGRYKAVRQFGGRACAVNVNDRIRRILTFSGIHKIIEIQGDTNKTGVKQGRNEHGLR